MRTVRPWQSLVLAAAFAVPAHAADVDMAFPAFGGLHGAHAVCNASAVSGDTLFLGGSLRWAGPLTGGGVPMQAVDLTSLAEFPRVNGHVLAAAADGAGGWFIGGAFTHVGGLPRANLAHVLADLSVDSWSPGTNSDVIAVLATPTEVYFSGTFTSVNGQSSSGFAGVSRATGGVVLNPAVGGLVAALASDGAQLFVGGEFSSVHGAARSRLASFQLADHALTAWSPIATGGDVYALRCANGVVYAGGNFGSVSGLARSGLAAIDPATGTPTTWDPQVGSSSGYGVRAILPMGDRVVVGGDFSQVGGVVRQCLAAVDTASGALTPWDPQVRSVTPGVGAVVTSLEIVGTDVLAGGVFEQVHGVARSDLVRLDTTTAEPIAPAPEAPGEARALVASGANVLVGGRFATLGPARRGDLIAVRASTGELLPWSPDATDDVIESQFGSHFLHGSAVEQLAVDDERVVVVVSSFDAFLGSNWGSNSGSTRGSNRHTLRAYSRASGDSLWSVPLSGTVTALAMMDSLLIVGGDFLTPASGLLAFDARTGTAVDWGGTTSGGAVLALLPTREGLVVGGTFTAAGGQPRARLALLERASGLATDWNPGADGAVTAFALAGTTLYCGGDFGTLGGQPRSRLGAVSLATGAADEWNPGANAPVTGLAIDHGVLLASGAFTIAGGQQHVCVAALDLESGAALPWDGGIGVGHGVNTVRAGGGRVFAGGSHVTADNEPTVGFTAFSAPDAALGEGAGRERPTLHVEPQPARTVEHVRLRLPWETDAEIGLYDLSGRRLAVLAPWGRQPAGDISVSLESHQLKPGIYIVRALTTQGDIAGKLIVVP